MSDDAWIDVEWQTSVANGRWSIVWSFAPRMGSHAEALKSVVEMIAKRAIDVCAAQSESGKPTL